MARGYRPVQRDQEFLLPPNMTDWLPEDHLVWFVIDVVEKLDTSAFHRNRKLGGAGRRAYDPDMMLALLVYAYAAGERSSRRIERQCVDHVAFRVLCGQDAPDHCAIARFRSAHQEAFTGLFAQVLALCSAAGMARVGVVSIDGTKVAANAARGANRRPETVRREAAEIAAQIAQKVVAEATLVDEAEDADDDGDGPGGTDGLPPQFASHSGRAANLAKAIAELDSRERAVTETEAAERLDAEQYLADVASGARRASRRPAGVDPVRFHQARITISRKRIEELEGIAGHAAHRVRGDVRRTLKQATEALAKAETDLAAGIEPDLRGRAALRRASRARARGRDQLDDRVNTTDPDSRMMTEGAGGGSVQAYNVQFAVTDDHIVLAAHVSQDANDSSGYTPTITAATDQARALDKTIGLVLMDAGYFNEDNLTTEGPERLIAPGKSRTVYTQAAAEPTSGPPPDGLSAKDAMRHRMRDPVNIERYKRRGATVEPIFGHLKEHIKLRRFACRGLTAVTAEVNLAASAINILRLHNTAPAT